MKNGAWSENDFRLFSALRDYDDQKFINEKMGMDDDDMISRDDYINLLVESNAEQIRIQKNMKEKMEKLKKMKKKMNPDSLMPEEYGKISRYDRDSQILQEYGSGEEYKYIAPFTEEELSRPEVMEKMTKLRLFCYNLEQEFLEKERIKKKLGDLRKKIAIMELCEVEVKGIEREMMEVIIESLRQEERMLRMELGEDVEDKRRMRMR